MEKIIKEIESLGYKMNKIDFTTENFIKKFNKMTDIINTNENLVFYTFDKDLIINTFYLMNMDVDISRVDFGNIVVFMFNSGEGKIYIDIGNVQTENLITKLKNRLDKRKNWTEDNFTCSICYEKSVCNRGCIKCEKIICYNCCEKYHNKSCPYCRSDWIAR